jgi:feruloyl esterase
VVTLTPVPDSSIHIDVWMPESEWNGKFEGTGSGGYAGFIFYDNLGERLRKGYSVANTDMGTSSSSPLDGDALIGHPEKWRDWGWRSTHEMTLAAKAIIRANYGQSPEHSYFFGCSTGGEQGLMEAQRFPNDYDGIAAGAPANNRTHLHEAILWNSTAGQMGRGNYVSPHKLKLVGQTVLSACKREDAGLKDDPFLSSPDGCRWDPVTIECKEGDLPSCLTRSEAETIRKLYQGPVNPRTGSAIYPGLPRGSEFGWSELMSGPNRGHEPPFDALFK